MAPLARLKETPAKISTAGLALSIFLFAESMAPSFLPRKTSTQLLLSAIFIAAGYGLGAGSGALYRKLNGKEFHIPKRFQNILIVLLLVYASFLVFERSEYQATQAVDLGVDEVSPTPWLVLLLAPLIGWAMLLAARELRRLAHFIRGHIQKRSTFILAFVGSWALLAGVIYFLLSLAVLQLQNNLENLSASYDEGIEQPQSPLRSGSPESFATWEGLTRKGRQFVSVGPRAESISKLHDNAMDPIRIYGGLGDAPDVSDRVDLIMSEMDRTKAFERSNIAVFTPSGTGWVNDAAVNSVEYLLGGDVASVTIQYSEISSFLQYLVNQDAAGEANSMLLERIIARLQQIPESERPTLYMSGESLGSQGSQEYFKEFEAHDFQDVVSGIVWVGSPSNSELWTRLRSSQDENTDTIRFGTSADDLSSQGEWGDTRVAFLYNNNDPVVWLNRELLYSSPDWLEGETPEDVSPRMKWRPVLTYAQLLFELLPSSSQPSGVAHSYIEEIPHVWADVIDPPNWSDQKTQTMIDILYD